MIDLIATRAMTYSTRRLQADDSFQARPRDARLLIAVGKARRADVPAGNEAAQLLARADGMNFMAFKAEAAKLIGEDTPSKKTDIIAALELLAGF